ncbi:MAG: amidohydrolase family protein [Anaerolineales bacterium]
MPTLENPARLWRDARAGVRRAGRIAESVLGIARRRHPPPRRRFSLCGGLARRTEIIYPQAFAGYTLGAAYAAYMEDRLGKLAPGFLADFIVLEQDPFTCNPTELLALESSATMVNGEWVYTSF